MKGYRTIIFSAFMTLVGMVGWKISPETANSWVDIFMAAWGIGAILLRQITTTPVGSSVALPLAPQTSTSDDVVSLRQDLQTIMSHVRLTPALAQLTANMSQKFDAIAAVLQAVAPAPAATVAPQPAPAAAVQAAAAAVDDSVAATLAPSEMALSPAPVAALAQDLAPVAEALAQRAAAPPGVILPAI